MSKELRRLANQLAIQTADAYSYDRFQSWSAVAFALIKAGYSLEETEAIMRSKWARWASDSSDRPYGRATAKCLVDFANKQGRPSLDELVAGDVRRRSAARLETGRWCYAIVESSKDENGYIPVCVIEGESGYRPMSGQGAYATPWYWGHTYEHAQGVCRQVNEKMGITHARAAEIVASSMRRPS